MTPAISSDAISPMGLAFDATGAVVNCVCANWEQDGAFTLTVADGSRPESVFPGRALSLRELVGDGYTVFRQQTSGGPGVNAAGANGFTFTPSGFHGFAISPMGLAFDAMGAVVNCVCPNWEQDGAFTLTVADGFRPESVFTNRALSLRELVGDGYTVLRQQTSGGAAVNVPGADGFMFSASGLTGFSPSPIIAFDSMGAVGSCTCANWNQSGTFTLSVTDGTRPSSVIPGRTLSLRSIAPDPLTVPDNGSAGSINLQVGGDAGPWDWSDYEDGLANSVLTAWDSFGSTSLAVIWVAGAVESGESGTGTVTIQRSDGSSPESTVSLETTVVEAPQLPVSCWPVLAVMLVVVTATLMGRHVDSRERPR